MSTNQLNESRDTSYEEWVNDEEQEITIPPHLTTTSSKIRFLTSKGLTRSMIAKKLQIRYQHVRNVQLQPLKTK